MDRLFYAYAHPIHSPELPIPVDSAAERRTLDLLPQTTSAAAGRPVRISKPLFDLPLAEATGWAGFGDALCRPGFLVELTTMPSFYDQRQAERWSHRHDTARIFAEAETGAGFMRSSPPPPPRPKRKQLTIGGSIPGLHAIDEATGTDVSPEIVALHGTRFRGQRIASPQRQPTSPTAAATDITSRTPAGIRNREPARGAAAAEEDPAARPTAAASKQCDPRQAPRSPEGW